MALIRILAAVLILGCIAFANEYKAQNGWGLPSRKTTSSITQGVVFDLAQKRLIVAEISGLVEFDQNGNTTNLLKQAGIRNLVGIGSGANLTLAWYQRDVVSDSGVWWWHKNKAEFVFTTPYSNFSLFFQDGQPVLVTAAQNRDKTELKLQKWGQAAKTIYQTALNIGALSANAIGSRTAMIFAQGYRNERDEKYDLMFLELGLPVREIAPAVYLGKEQKFLLAIHNNNFMPVWWYETRQEQQIAAFTKQHNPRLALLENQKIIEFAPFERLIGQAENRIYYTNKNRVSSLDLSTKETRLEVLTSDTLTTAHISGQHLVWQSLNQDGFSSELWSVDKAVPLRPIFLTIFRQHWAGTRGTRGRIYLDR